jgi:hypothetical protein
MIGKDYAAVLDVVTSRELGENTAITEQFSREFVFSQQQTPVFDASDYLSMSTAPNADIGVKSTSVGVPPEGGPDTFLPKSFGSFGYNNSFLLNDQLGDTPPSYEGAFVGHQTSTSSSDVTMSGLLSPMSAFGSLEPSIQPLHLQW